MGARPKLAMNEMAERMDESCELAQEMNECSMNERKIGRRNREKAHTTTTKGVEQAHVAM